MKHTQDFHRSGVAFAVALALLGGTLGATDAHATRAAALSVQNAPGAGAPVVRSVQRDSADAERVAAGPNETVELLLADGTSVTLAPGTTLVMDRYRYDRGSRLGELQLTLESGAIRAIGGALNNTGAIVVNVPGGKVALDNAVVFVQVGGGRTDVSFVAGRAATVTGATESRTLGAVGAAATLDASGAFIGGAKQLALADVRRLATLVNPGLASGVVPAFVVEGRAAALGGGPGTQEAAAVEGEAVSEDTVAKDVKITPVLPDPIAPARPCAAGNCTAGAPNFDLGTSVGTIGSRQAGRTPGAQWQRGFYQSDAIASAGILNTPAVDYYPAGGFRNTTARIYAADPTTPFALTLSAANPPTFATSYGDPNFTCRSDLGGACLTSPIVTLYAGTPGAQTVGAVYRFAGENTGARFSSLQIAFPFGMTTGRFNSYELLFSVPVDYAAPGVLQRASVDLSPTSCVDANGGFCETTFQYPTQADLDAAIASRADIAGYGAYANGGALGLFSSYGIGLVPRVETLQNGDQEFFADVVVSGTSSYDVRSLQAGFSKTTITNFQSDLRQKVCALAPGDQTSNCAALAIALFGADNPDPGGIGDPQINFDEEPGWDPNFPTYFTTTSDVVVRADDSFLAVEAISRLPGDSQRFLYATGSVSGVLQAGTAAQGATLDSFRLSPGLDAGVALGRAFLRPGTLLNVAPGALLSSDLLVLNAPYVTNVADGARVLQYDFAAIGGGADQTSTISVTLGTLDYDQATRAAQLSGRTVGSTARSGTTRYSGSVSSALFSTAAGGGNPALAGTGRAGYLVLENYDPNSAPNGGVERTIENGAATTTNYALLRFGQVVAGGTQAAPARATATLTGFFGGLAEIVDSGATGGSVSLVPLLSSDLQLALNGATGSVGAAFSTTVAGTSATTVTLGGATGLSAYTRPKEYAAMTAAAPNLAAGTIADAGAANAAIVSGAPLIGSATQGWTGTLDAATRGKLSTDATSGYRHLQWGFFFGDVQLSGTQRAHAHLASWVAGRATAVNAPLPSGTADYSGHVFANVSNGTQTYAAAGTYQNRWDFAARSGTGSMSLDGQSYSVTTRLLGLRREGTALTSDSTTQFEGLIALPGSRSYVGSLAGTFVAAEGAAATDGLAQRSALMGQFGISRTLNGSDYRAIGTFGAERAGP